MEIKEIDLKISRSSKSGQKGPCYVLGSTGNTRRCFGILGAGCRAPGAGRSILIEVVQLVLLGLKKNFEESLIIKIVGSVNVNVI